MIYPKPKDKKTEKELNRQAYELEKEDLIFIFREQKYDEKHLNEFLINSLKKDFEEELKEDGLL